MISVAEALRLVYKAGKNLGTEVVPLLDSGNRILAQDIFADRDFPPFDRVTMDGIAIRHAAFERGIRTFTIAGIQAAGNPALKLWDDGACIEIMTGASMPGGADTVVPYEDCIIEGGAATIQVASLKRNQNLHLQGSDCKSGSLLVAQGQHISPAVTGILATVGIAELAVKRLPKVAVCSTGEELVDINHAPLPHQIRRSNSYMLLAALRVEGIIGDAYHLPDDKAQMQPLIADLMARYDVLIFSGAVSKGKYDFLPEVLSSLGMQTIFHRIAQRPGKPLLFGQFTPRPTVFGLPGNPASTLVCYTIYFLHWLRTCLHIQAPALTARLDASIHFSPALTYHMLVSISFQDGHLIASPIPTNSSGDLVTLSAAHALLSLPAEKNTFEAGAQYPLTMLPGIKLSDILV